MESTTTARTLSARSFLFPALAAIAGAAASLWIASTSPHLSGSDSFYHVKMAMLLPEIGFTREFPWLHWTIFRDAFVSHHTGFQALLVPFVHGAQAIGLDPQLGAKLLVAFGMAATFALTFILLRSIGAPWPLAWTLFLLLAPWHFWLRHSYCRAPVIALPLLLAGLLLAIRGRPLGLALLGMVFVQVYFGAVLFLLVPGCLIAGHLLAGSATRRHATLLAAATLGTVAGFIVNPYFPDNLAFLRVQLFDTGLGAPVDVGNEWRPLSTWGFARMSAPLLCLLGAALVARLRKGVPLDGTGLGLLLLQSAWLALTWKSRRFVEYWPVFAVLCAADLARPALAAMIGPALSRRTGTAAIAALFALALPAAANLAHARSRAVPAHDPDALRPALDAIAARSEPGSMILTDDWDAFPACFYLNHHNTYAVGLDPVFTSRPYPELWERYRLLTRGRAPGPLGPRFTVLGPKTVRIEDIRDVFGARYVLVHRDHAQFRRSLESRPDLFARIYPAGPPGPAATVLAFEVAGVPPTRAHD